MAMKEIQNKNQCHSVFNLESIKQQCRFILMCGFLLTSTATFAQETETCANGAGTVITGAITGHKYCKSNNLMTWFNAYAWCDGQNSRLFDLSDCECGNTTANCAGNTCPELFKVGGDVKIWTKTPKDSATSYNIKLSAGYITYTGRENLTQAYGLYALCF